MKIGIITFHWATNYGAILQAYALQEYLRNQGHQVEIINYKPRHFDFGWKYLRRPWLLKGLKKDLVARKKELKLIPFREDRLITTKRRFFSVRELSLANMIYDVIFSGSDQVLNPSYTISGENHPTSAYYLTFATRSKRIGYAVSFGCTVYPSNALKYAEKWINAFDSVGVREDSGIKILNQMNFRGKKQVVPDPTILYGENLFDGIKIPKPKKENYLCVYILRGASKINSDNVVYVDEMNNPVSMEEWLGLIIYSRGLITNSYHGMIMAILNHVPFVAVKSKADGAGMNDRFVTLLSYLDLEDRLVDSLDDYQQILSQIISWEVVDEKLAEFRKVGAIFIENAILQ